MASYTELEELRNDTTLKARVRVATMIAAETIRTEAAPANSAQRLAWAKSVFENPSTMGEQMFWAVLAANKDVAKATIQAAGDAAIQTNVDAAVDLFAGT